MKRLKLNNSYRIAALTVTLCLAAPFSALAVDYHDETCDYSYVAHGLTPAGEIYAEYFNLVETLNILQHTSEFRDGLEATYQSAVEDIINEAKLKGLKAVVSEADLDELRNKISPDEVIYSRVSYNCDLVQ